MRFTATLVNTVSALNVISSEANGGLPFYAVTYNPISLFVLNDFITLNDLSNVPV
jgi:hypothetical protein